MVDNGIDDRGLATEIGVGAGVGAAPDGGVTGDNTSPTVDDDNDDLEDTDPDNDEDTFFHAAIRSAKLPVFAPRLRNRRRASAKEEDGAVATENVDLEDAAESSLLCKSLSLERTSFAEYDPRLIIDLPSPTA